MEGLANAVSAPADGPAGLRRATPGAIISARVPERVCHIVPAVPPEFNGLGDYARQLWRHWPEPRPEWHVAALRVPAGAAEAWPGVAFHPFRPTAEGLLEALLESRADAVALHYVGHGYHPKGVPLWLPKALARWKSATGGRLVTFFHEVVSRKPFPSSASLLRPVAELAVRRLLRESDHWLTSNVFAASELMALDRNRSVCSLVPVGSNITPLRRRPLATPSAVFSGPMTVIIFGTVHSRTQALQAHRAFLMGALAQQRLGLLLLVGSGNVPTTDDALLEYIPPHLLRVQLNQSPDGVSRLLNTADCALLHYPPTYLHKSGVYAACLSHSVWPVCIETSKNPLAAYVPVSTDGTLLPFIDLDLIHRFELDYIRASWFSIVEIWRESLG